MNIIITAVYFFQLRLKTTKPFRIRTCKGIYDKVLLTTGYSICIHREFFHQKSYSHIKLKTGILE